MNADDFDKLVREYRPRLVGYARNIVGLDRAEDVVQTALARAWAAHDQEIRHPRAWLFEIVRNAALNALKRKANVAGPLSEWVATPFDLEREVEARDRFRRMLVAITDLPENQKQALLLSSGGARPNIRAVAKQMNLSEGAVRMLIFRGRQHILPKIADVG